MLHCCSNKCLFFNIYTVRQYFESMQILKTNYVRKVSITYYFFLSIHLAYFCKYLTINTEGLTTELRGETTTVVHRTNSIGYVMRNMTGTALVGNQHNIWERLCRMSSRISVTFVVFDYLVHLINILHSFTVLTITKYYKINFTSSILCRYLFTASNSKVGY